MVRNHVNNHEEWAVEGLSNMLLKGNLDIVRNIVYLLVRITAGQTTALTTTSLFTLLADKSAV